MRIIVPMHAHHPQPLLHRLLMLALAAVAITGCGGDTSSDSTSGTAAVRVTQPGSAVRAVSMDGRDHRTADGWARALAQFEPDMHDRRTADGWVRSLAHLDEAREVFLHS